MSALFRTPLAYAPAPSGRTIDALLQFADVTEDLGQGRICLRMSPKRARSAEVKAAFGADAKRAADLAVIYDEREAEVVEIGRDEQLLTREEEERFEREFDAALMFWNTDAHVRNRRSPKRYGAWR
jgi:hypothetical protein